jgi:hypothetical protein
MTRFFILNGNHREQYRDLVSKGWDACLEYFRENKDQWNERTNNPDKDMCPTCHGWGSLPDEACKTLNTCEKCNGKGEIEYESR